MVVEAAAAVVAAAVVVAGNTNKTESMIDPKTFYASRTKEYSEQLKQLKQRSVYISAARLLCFTLLAFFIYLYISKQGSAYSAGIIISAIAFIAFVRISISLTDKKNLTAKLLFINQNESVVINQGDNSFDDGSSIAGLEMHASDLDIFGKRSLYHVLNRSVTAHGAEQLSGLLNQPPAAKEVIIELQRAVTQLCSQADKRQLILAHALLQDGKENNIEEITEWIDTPEKLLPKKSLNIVRFVLPMIALSGLVLYLYNNNPIVAGMAVLINWVLTGTFAKYILQQHNLIGKKEMVLQQYGLILKKFSAVDEGESALLKSMKQTATGARQEILTLSRLSALFDQRLNLLVTIFANSFLLYDIHVMFAMEKWKRQNRMHFLSWINTVGEIEKLNSLTTFQFNRPDYIIPVVSAGAPVIEATALGHPLIPERSQVVNDITAGRNEKLLLITGSNMSGKSTFLRTIGINTLMAQCGLPVCAASFSFSPMRIISSIRISDSLQENTSYFMAELKRLKEIIDYLDTGKPALVLIDEVLRGTNSEDKKYGSEELIKRLTGYSCLSFFASHDLSLGVLENELPGKSQELLF